MADNLTTQTSTLATVPGSKGIATREVTYSGDASQHIAPVGLVTFSGSDDAKTATDVNDSNPLPVDDAGGSLTVDNAALSVTGGGVESSALRVTIASDSTGVLSVDDNGSTLSVDDGGASLTVDGTVAVSGTVTVDLGVNNDVTVTSGNITADTELPTAAALADNASNPTAPAVGAFGMVWDGATWDRAPGTAADGALVNLGSNNDVTVTGTVTANLAAGTNNIGDVDVLSVPAPLNVTGGGTEASALRVTIASDSTGVLSVDDNGGALTVDNAGTFAVQAAQSGTWTVDLGATDNAVLDTIASPVATISATPLQRVAIFDNADAQITSFGGGTQYTEDAAAAANPTGTAPILVRADTPATVTSTDGDNVAQRGTNYGAAYVQVVTSSGAFVNSFGGSGGTASVDDSAFTVATDSGTPMMGIVTADAVDSGDVGVVGMDANRNLKVSIEVDNVGIGGGTQYTEDAAAAANPVGTALNLVRADTLSATTVDADGDNIAARAASTGAQYVEVTAGTTKLGSATDGLLVNLGTNNDVTVTGTVTANLAAGTNNIGDVDVLSVPAPLSTTGNGTAATALRVTVASDSTGTVAATQSGTWNVTNVSGTVSLPTGAATAAKQPALGTAGTASADVITVQGIASMTPLLVNGSGVTQPVSGTVTANLAAGTNNIGDVDVLTVPAPLSTTGNGTAATALRVTVASDSTGTIAATQSGTWNVNNVSGTVSLPTGAATSANQSTEITALQLIDNPIVAHDAAISGSTGVNVVGFNARSTDPTAVADADATQGLATLLGKQVVYPYALPGSSWSYAAASGGITNTSGVTAKAAAGASVRNYITSCQVINGHATVNTDVQIRDGASGTVLWRGFAQNSGGGASVRFDPPLRGTANTLVEVACGTTGSATYFNLQGFTAAE